MFVASLHGGWNFSNAKMRWANGCLSTEPFWPDTDTIKIQSYPPSETQHTQRTGLREQKPRVSTLRSQLHSLINTTFAPRDSLPHCSLSCVIRYPKWLTVSLWSLFCQKISFTSHCVLAQSICYWLQTGLYLTGLQIFVLDEMQWASSPIYWCKRPYLHEI